VELNLEVQGVTSFFAVVTESLIHGGNVIVPFKVCHLIFSKGAEA